MSNPDSPIPEGYCQCGCGQKTNLADRTDRNSGRAKGEPARYIRGHQRRSKRAWSEGPNPSGLCMCGCGKRTPIASRTNGATIKGTPQKYCKGHKPPTTGEGPNPSGLCMCGCGQPAPIAKFSNRKKGEVKGKPRRYILGHTGRWKDRDPGEGPNPSGLCMCGCGRKTEIAKRNRYEIGQLKGQPLRYINGHNPIKQGSRYTINHETGCWEWHDVMPNGYGHLWHPTEKRNVGAHRYMYEVRFGPIPNGYHIHHLCHNRCCVNPDHLEAIPPVAHVRLESKLDETAVDEIRRLWASGAYTQNDLGEMFGVGQMTISDVVTGVTWSDATRQRAPRSSD